VLRRPVESAEYTGEVFEQACLALGVKQSMGRVGSALDNAVAESFNSTIKVEYIHRRRFATRAEARYKIATWIVEFYNPAPASQRLRGHVTSQLREVHG
jgi:transposase InsO family protein